MRKPPGRIREAFTQLSHWRHNATSAECDVNARCSAGRRLVAARHYGCTISHRRGWSRPIAIARDLHRDFPLRVPSAHTSFTGRRTARFSTLTADCRHVGTIATDGDTALAPRIPRFVGRPFMRRPLFVGCPPTFAGDLALTRGIHRRESASALSGHTPPGHPEVLNSAAGGNETEGICHRTSIPRRYYACVTANLRPPHAVPSNTSM